MTRPKLALPPLGMPWGRAIESELDAQASGIAAQTGDASSTGSVFAGRANQIQSQIAAIPSIAAVYSLPVPNFSVTRTSTGASGYVYNSSTFTFNPPSQAIGYSYTVIVNMSASGTLLTFPTSILRTNGTDNAFRHENLQPGFETSGTFSLLGTGTTLPGDTVNAAFALQTSSTGTLNFSNCTLWCIFSGSIL